MQNKILGLHHITAIAGNAQSNYYFYTKILGLRLVKKTVNFDDPDTYHLYFGNEVGAPGSILTFFPWENIGRGRPGTGMATEIGFSVSKGSLLFWQDRLKTRGFKSGPIAERFGEKYLGLEDPDGLLLNLVEPHEEDQRKPWARNDLQEEYLIKGFHSVLLTLRDAGPTASVLTNIFGYHLVAQQGHHYRYQTNAVDTANIVDIVEVPEGKPGINAAGTNHHVAFRVQNDRLLMEFRQKVKNYGLHITEKINRNYFYSLYFREPGGVLFELASDNPGFAIDEEVDQLGTRLMLPAQFEGDRKRIEQTLPHLVP